MLSGEATKTNFIVFGLTRSGIEPTTCSTRGEHTNHYTTDAFSNNGAFQSYKHTGIYYYPSFCILLYLSATCYTYIVCFRPITPLFSNINNSNNKLSRLKARQCNYWILLSLTTSVIRSNDHLM